MVEEKQTKSLLLRCPNPECPQVTFRVVREVRKGNEQKLHICLESDAAQIPNLLWELLFHGDPKVQFPSIHDRILTTVPLCLLPDNVDWLYQLLTGSPELWEILIPALEKLRLPKGTPGKEPTYLCSALKENLLIRSLAAQLVREAHLKAGRYSRHIFRGLKCDQDHQQISRREIYGSLPENIQN